MNAQHSEKIAEFLGLKLPEARDIEITNYRKATEGFSYQTILFTATWKDQNRTKISKDYVARIEPKDAAAVGPCDLRSQYRLLKALQETEVPVPRVLWFYPSSKYLEKPFFLMERTDGEVPTPWNVEHMTESHRKQMAENFVLVLSKIHGLDWKKAKLQFMSDNLDADPAILETERWYRIARKTQLRAEPILTEAYLWLKNNRPSLASLALCHGDFRLGNFIWSDEKIVAMLDWEISSISDPMSDLGWLCQKCWRTESRPELMTGLVKREELYELYEKFTGEKVDPKRVFFWEVLANLHMATILLQAFRGLQDGGIRDIRLLSMEEFLYKPILQEITTLLKF